MRRFEHDFNDREDGLSHCKICGGGEGSLPTLCPGRKLSAAELDEIYANKLDYHAGPMTRGAQWWTALPVTRTIDAAT